MSFWKIFRALLPAEKQLPEKMTTCQVGEMVASKKVILVREKKIFERYPDRVVEKIRSYTDAELLEVLKNNLELLIVAEERYYDGLTLDDGVPRFSCGSLMPNTPPKGGLVQSIYPMVVRQPDDFEVWLAVNLLRPCGKDEPMLLVEVNAMNIDSTPLELDEYCQCRSCGDWGCWTCNFNGAGGGWGR